MTTGAACVLDKAVIADLDLSPDGHIELPQELPHLCSNSSNIADLAVKGLHLYKSSQIMNGIQTYLESSEAAAPAVLPDFNYRMQAQLNQDCGRNRKVSDGSFQVHAVELISKIALDGEMIGHFFIADLGSDPDYRYL